MPRAASYQGKSGPFAPVLFFPPPPPHRLGILRGYSGENTANLHIKDAPYPGDFTSHLRLHSIKYGHCINKSLIT